MKYRSIDTRLIHAGEPNPRYQGAVSIPIFQSANFVYSGETSYDDLKYIRLNNTPNHRALHEKLAALEGAESAVVTASGMAAISTALLAVLSAGDHLLVQRGLYGGTHSLVTEDLPDWGIEYTMVDPTDPKEWARECRETTRAFYLETLTNPTLEVPDLAAAVEFCKRRGLVSLIDNTFATPINFRPPEHGFDLSLHSATKYLNGHSDIVAGAVIGSAYWVGKVVKKLNHLGGSLDPHACFLLHRGLKTLALRVRRQNETGQRLARYLTSRPEVTRVNYPTLADHPPLEGGGGVLSFELEGGTAAAVQLIEHLRLPVEAPSLGGVETLVTRPASTSHSGMSPEERRSSGVADGLVRVSVGIEDCEDLLDDFRQALDAVEERLVDSSKPPG